jgi:excisionase family DNA binding protein
MMSAAELAALIRDACAEVLDEYLAQREHPSSDGLLDRAGAARYLRVSLAQLDKLTRTQGLPYHRVGDCRRFVRAEVLAWMQGVRS